MIRKTIVKQAGKAMGLGAAASAPRGFGSLGAKAGGAVKKAFPAFGGYLGTIKAPVKAKQGFPGITK